MNAVTPGASLLALMEDGKLDEYPSDGPQLFLSEGLVDRAPSTGGESSRYVPALFASGQHSSYASTGPFLLTTQPRGRQFGFDLGLSMVQGETGLNETGTANILTSGTGSYSYPYDCAVGRSRKSTPSHQPVTMPASLFRYSVVKRVGDLALTALAMPVLLPILLLLALLVKLTSPGPVFFSHRRICKNGAFFSMWKFRTMCVNSSEVLERYLSAHPEARAEWNLTHKLQDDPRVTRVGRSMRRLSLDELPQIWNVITGRMSLVGPRPIVAAEVEKYAECFHCYTRVKPGVTGLWQVSGRSKLSYEARVKLDCDYVTHWSLSRDLRILMLTIKSVVNQDGAY